MGEAIILPSEISSGKDREVQTILADRWRKLVVIQIRRGALLADHSAKVPITIQTLAGRGLLRVAGEEHLLVPGVLVPVDAGVVHSVQGEPDVAILVTFFRQAGASEGNETTARFE
jgi:quercetin dioxygenase-like cupin family protein